MTLGTSLAGWRRAPVRRLLCILFLLAACGTVMPPSSSMSPSAALSGSPPPAPTADAAGASSHASAAPSGRRGPSGPPPPEPQTRVFVIVFENKDASEILSGDQAPYLASLAREYAHAANYRAVAYPSQPNYLALFSGSTHGISDNELHEIEGPTLADQVEDASLSWRVVAENLGPGCFTEAFSLNGPDGEGIYSRKHNPAISFTSISRDPARCANITDLSHFDADAAEFTLIVPNNCHSMHDCSIADGDAWLRGFLPRILESDAYREGGVVFVTFDEDRGDGDNGVATVVVSERARKGAASERPYTHYSLLRTVQELLGLPCLAESCSAEPMNDLLDGLASD